MAATDDEIAELEREFEIRAEIRNGVILEEDFYNKMFKTGDVATFDDLIDVVAKLQGYTENCHTAYPMSAISFLNVLIYLKQLQKTGSIGEQTALLESIKRDNKTLYDLFLDIGGDTMFNRLYLIERRLLRNDPIPWDEQNRLDFSRQRARIDELNRELEREREKVKALSTVATATPIVSLSNKTAEEAIKQLQKAITTLKGPAVSLTTEKTSGLNDDDNNNNVVRYFSLIARKERLNDADIKDLCIFLSHNHKFIHAAYLNHPEIINKNKNNE